MPLIELNRNPSPRDLRLFAGLAIVFFGAVAWLVHRQSGSFVAAGAIVGVGVAIGATGLAAPRAIRPLYLGWTAATYPIGWLVSHALLAIVYYGLFTPWGLVLRLVRGDPLTRRFDRAAATYWVKRPRREGMSRYFRQH